MRGWLILAGALILSVPAMLLAQGEHGRRAGAELLVLIGDVKKLSDETVAEQYRNGLRARVEGSLSGLSLLLRLAAEERKRVPVALDGAALRTWLNQGSYSALVDRLLELSKIYGLDSSGFSDAPLSPDGSRRAREIHRTLCSACHDHPYPDTERPALNLFEQARASSYSEFLARMLVGVRGDRVTAIENPFSDREIAALIAYYRSPVNAVR